MNTLTLVCIGLSFFFFVGIVIIGISEMFD